MRSDRCPSPSRGHIKGIRTDPTGYKQPSNKRLFSRGVVHRDPAGNVRRATSTRKVERGRPERRLCITQAISQATVNWGDGVVPAGAAIRE